jgi:hypothetical protein
MINLPELAEHLQKDGLIAKSFADCTRTEILKIVEAVFSSVGDEVPPGGWSKPRLEDGSLVIPFDCHPSYHWWKDGGKSIYEILTELDAPFAVARKYVAKGFGHPMTEADWNNQLIPF